jgi:hypothetical protein
MATTHDFRTIWRRICLVICALLGMAAGDAAAQASDELDNAEIATNLLEIMFGSEFVGEEAQVVRKWQGPMRLAIYAHDPPRYHDVVAAHLDRLRQLTGLDVALVDGDTAGQNAYVLIVGREQFYSLADRHLGQGKNPRTNTYLDCFGYFHATEGGEIRELTAVIPNYITDEQLRRCVIEEVTQAIGLPNESFTVRLSVFNDDDVHADLTWQDELFLRVLYDQHVKPGMGRSEFEVIARRIIEDLRPIN